MKQVKKHLSPLIATFIVVLSVLMILVLKSVFITWAYILLLIFLISIFLKDLNFIRYALISTFAFTLPLLIIHGIINPNFPVSSEYFSFISIREEGIIFALKIGGRLAIISTIGIVIAWVPILAGIQFLLKLNFPKIIILPIAMSMAILKEIQRKISTVYEAQQSRGIPVSGSLLQRIKAIPSIVIPVAVSTLVDSQRRADCLNSRQFENSIILSNNLLKIAKPIINSLELNQYNNINLSPGSFIEWVAPTDSGKSMLAKEIALHQENSSEVKFKTLDNLTIPAITITKEIGWVPSDARWLLSSIGNTVSEEIYTALLNYKSEMQSLDTVIELLKVFQLEHLKDNHPFTLSGGETIRLSLAITIAKNPRFLLLDQSFEFLDPEQRNIFHNLLDKYREENNIGILYFTNRNSIQNGKKIEMNNSSRFSKLFSSSNNNKILLEADSLSFSYSSGFSLKNISFSLSSGQIILLNGINGSGKTTILKLLALLLPCEGELNSFNIESQQLEQVPHKKKKHLWANNVGYTFQNPTDQLFKGTVSEEIMFRSKSIEDYNQVINIFKLEELLDKNPLDLPLPLQRLVSIASILAMRPPVILLDEPSAFLDENLTLLLCNAISELAQVGHTFLVVSHDSFIANALNHETWLLNEGIIQESV